MRLLSCTLAAMLLALGIGIALGAGILRNFPETIAAADRPAAASNAAPIPGTAPERMDSGGASSVRQTNTRPLAVIFTRQSADIVARSEGALEAVYVNVGDRLKAGDVIAKVESYSVTQQLNMAEATLRSILAEQLDGEVELEDAESRYRRREELAQSGLISREDLATAKVQVDRAGIKLQVTQARVAEQMARVNDAKQSLANTIVRAAFAGTVAARYLDAGGTVRPGTPIISLIRPEDLWVRFAIPETQRARMSIGTAIIFQAAGSAGAIPGVIESVSPTTAASQELLIEARLKVPRALQDQVRPGGSGFVSSQER